MALNLVNLDRRVRELMLTELDLDLAKNDVYLPDRLSKRGREAFVGLLREAIDRRDDAWLAARLGEGPYFNPREQRRKPGGGYISADVPANAPAVLAEGEFNRFYIRALCLLAIADGIPELMVYRAKEVKEPRAASERKLGTRMDPRRLLLDLRTHQGVDPALRGPCGAELGAQRAAAAVAVESDIARDALDLRHPRA